MSILSAGEAYDLMLRKPTLDMEPFDLIRARPSSSQDAATTLLSIPRHDPIQTRLALLSEAFEQVPDFPLFQVRVASKSSAIQRMTVSIVAVAPGRIDLLTAATWSRSTCETVGI